MSTSMFCPDALEVGTLADWFAIVGAAVAAAVAVWGSFRLWERQLKKKSESLESTAEAIFRGVYERLVELEQWAEFDKWRRYVSAASDQSLPDEIAWRAHKEAFLAGIEAHLISLDLALSNFKAIQGSLYEVSPKKMHALLRLHGFIGGAPAQIKRIKAAWEVADCSRGPVKLPEEHRYVLSKGISGGAYFLNHLDGGNRSRAREFEAIARASKELHAAAE